MIRMKMAEREWHWPKNFIVKELLETFHGSKRAKVKALETVLNLERNVTIHKNLKKFSLCIVSYMRRQNTAQTVLEKFITKK